MSIIHLVMLALFAAVVVSGVFGFIAYVLVRWYDIKHNVEVEIFHVGKKFQKKSFYNCKKIKYRNKEGFESYALVGNKGKLKLPFYSDYAITRTTDGKVCSNFTEIEGKFVPFLVNAEMIAKTETMKTKGKEDTIVETIEVTTSLKNTQDDFTKERLDKIVADVLRWNIDDYLTLGDKKPLSAIFWILIIFAVIALIGVIIYFGTTGG